MLFNADWWLPGGLFWWPDGSDVDMVTGVSFFPRRADDFIQLGQCRTINGKGAMVLYVTTMVVGRGR